MGHSPTATIQLSRRDILKNIATLFSGNLLAQAISALALLLTARQLGPSEYGQYTSILTLCTFASVLFSLGMDSWFLREAGREPNRLSIFLGSIITIKFILGGLWVIGLTVVTTTIHLAIIPSNLLLLATLLIWFDDLFITTLGAFKATFRNNLTSILLVSSDGLWFLATLFWIQKDQSQPAVYIASRAVAALLSLIISSSLVWWLYRLKPRLEIIKRLRHEILPYAASEFLAMAFLRVDILIVGFILGPYAVGLYAPALGLTNMMFLLQGAVFSVMTPILSNQFYTNQRNAWRTVKRMTWAQVTVGIGLASLLFLSANTLVTFLGTRFIGTEVVIQILSINILIHSISYAMAIVLIATNQQEKRMYIQAGAVAFDVLANVLVVKWAGILGAATVYVLAECIIAIGYSTIVIRYYKKNKPVPNKPNILLINVHSIRNAGDAALTEEAMTQLHGVFPESRFTLVMNDPQMQSGDTRAIGSLFSWVKEDGKWNLFRLAWLLPSCLIPVFCYRLFGLSLFWLTPSRLRDLIQTYFEADIIISIPGGFFYSSGLGLTLLITSLTMGLAILAGKPLYILPQSYGPLRHEWECRIARWIYKRARLIMARERLSIEQLEKCGIHPSSCQVVPDLAFGFRGADPTKAVEWLRTNGINPNFDRPLLGISVLNWEAQNPTFRKQELYEKAIACTIRDFITNLHGNVLLLPQCSGPSNQEDDRIPARRIASLLSDMSEDILTVDEPLPPDLLKAVLGQMDLVIGTRMHSNIFALSQNVPVIAIGYLPKTMGIAQMVGIEEWVIDIGRLDENNLTKVFTDLWNERERVRDHLSQIIPHLIQQSQCAGTLVANDFASLTANTKYA